MHKCVSYDHDLSSYTHTHTHAHINNTTLHAGKRIIQRNVSARMRYLDT